MTKVKKDRLKIEFQTVFALVLKQHTYKCGRFLSVFLTQSRRKLVFQIHVYQFLQSAHICRLDLGG